MLATLSRIMRGWPHAPSSDKHEPAFDVRVSDSTTRIEAPWLDSPVEESGAFRAAANLAVDLAEAWLSENPERLAVHCAAAMFGPGIVAFSGKAKAGKSMLSARLAQAGHPIFTDDMLVLDGPGDRLAMSLGLAPRLRLPLPATVGASMDVFVADHAGPADADYLYLDLPPGIAPEFGRTAPLDALVILRRADRVPARIAPVDPGEAVDAVAAQRLSPFLGAREAEARLIALFEEIPCFALDYSDLDDALKALEDRFRETPRLAERPHRRYRAALDVALCETDGVKTLVRTGEPPYRLDDLSLGLWSLLAEPMRPEDAVAIVQGAFPETDPALIDRDIRLFFHLLARRGLIHPV